MGTNAKAQLIVTMDWESLAAGVRGAGVTVGGSDTGTMLAPETVRRLACDASVVPVVLGSAGEILDQGRAVRFFTAAQTRRLWLRDGGCTYPGVLDAAALGGRTPPGHWADFGPSDLGNAALLCERHHTIVHSRRLRRASGPRRVGERVEWDLHPAAATTSSWPGALPGTSVTPPHTPPHTRRGQRNADRAVPRPSEHLRVAATGVCRRGTCGGDTTLPLARCHASPPGYLSTSPTTKNIEPRMATMSAIRLPGSTSASTATLLNDAERSLSRHGVFSPRETR